MTTPEACPFMGRTAAWCEDQTHEKCKGQSERHSRMFGPNRDELYRQRVLNALRRIDETGHINGTST